MGNKAQMIKAILFDFDGTLANTMEDNYLCWKEAFNDEGIQIKREDYFPLEGASLKDVVITISDKYNLKNPLIEKLIKRKEDLFKKTYKFSLYPGVIELINILKEKKIITAIVSAAYRDRMFSTTPHDFLEKFNLIITSDQFEKFKPNPDPYLKAMERLNLKPNECIIIENSPFGIMSAKTSGAYCIAIASTMDKSFLKEADEIAENFEALKSSDKIKDLIS